MESILGNPLIFILVLIRVSVIIGFATFFNTSNFPKTAKVALSVFISALAVPMIKTNVSFTELQFVNAIIGEVLTGLQIGFVLMLVSQIFATAGGLIDTSIGLSMAQSFDPLSNMQTTIISKFLMISSVLFFVINDFPIKVIELVYQSFNMIPIGYLKLNPSIIGYILKAIIYGMTISIPIMLIVLLVDIILGIISRTIPQINIFSVGFIIKMMLGLVLIYFYSFILNNLVIHASEVLLSQCLQ